MQIHRVHKMILDGEEDAEIELNRYLPLCSLLLRSSPDWDHCREATCSEAGATGRASIVLDCVCGDPAHEIRMDKPAYRQQFRVGRTCSFVEENLGPAACRRSLLQQQQQQLLMRAPSFRPPPQHIPSLHVPIESLVPHIHAAPQYNLLPDLGACLRAIIVRRYFTDHHRKQWVKAASNMQLLGGYVPQHQQGPPSSGAAAGAPSSGAAFSAHPTGGAAATAARTASDVWSRSGLLCTSLLHDSIPCLRRSKRSSANQQQPQQKGSQGSRVQQQQLQQNLQATRHYPSVDVAACINVLHGTLLKLYPLGAKVPTFRSRVAMMARLSELCALSSDEQVDFLGAHPSLTRLCFMEYSLNALLDWLPCERQLLFQQHPVMHAYANIAVAMCDVFRQDAILTGFEDWGLLNRAAAASIERCLRACRFSPDRPLLASSDGHRIRSSGSGGSHSHHHPKSVHLNPASFHESMLQLPLMGALVGCAGERHLLHGCCNDEEEATSLQARLVDAAADAYGVELPWHRRPPCHDEQQQKQQDQGGALPASMDRGSFLAGYRGVHEHFSSFALPLGVYHAQMHALSCIHGACSRRLQAAQRLTLHPEQVVSALH